MFQSFDETKATQRAMLNGSKNWVRIKEGKWAGRFLYGSGFFNVCKEMDTAQIIKLQTYIMIYIKYTPYIYIPINI